LPPYAPMHCLFLLYSHIFLTSQAINRKYA
jgi:hypothetical protein